MGYWGCLGTQFRCLSEAVQHANGMARQCGGAQQAVQRKWRRCRARAPRIQCSTSATSAPPGSRPSASRPQTARPPAPGAPLLQQTTCPSAPPAAAGWRRARRRRGRRTAACMDWNRGAAGLSLACRCGAFVWRSTGRQVKEEMERKRGGRGGGRRRQQRDGRRRAAPPAAAAPVSLRRRSPRNCVVMYVVEERPQASAGAQRAT